MEVEYFLGRKVFMEDTVLDVLIVGSGAAAYNAAVHLYEKGAANCAIITENRLGGTSRNTGSDKQTYYKVACAGTEGDSPRGMAETLFGGGSMDGDIALCEAAHSLEEFFHLAAIGVDFPHNTYGEFAGYKTDHDPLQRASSIGPYTSRKMTEQLEREVKRRDIRIIDETRIVKLLHDEKAARVYGALCLVNNRCFALYLAKNVIFATGGPAGLYRNTVYPLSQFGASGILAREGINFANITEWQYGIGSVKFRWNLSGSYQQVIPRYIAVDDKGNEEEFLCNYFSTIGNLGRAVFLKGYEWPFNPVKIFGEGSSTVDYAIYREKHLKGRHIYLDFIHNPSGNDRLGVFNLDSIDSTARTYLAGSNALQSTPLERIKRLNPLAYELYLSHGIDLAKEYLEIDVLPQHHNGGAEVNIWWETTLSHLFAIGECAGTHGIKRPGGSALNSGQAGGLRAASFIAGHYLKDDAYFANPHAVLERARNEIKNFAKEFEGIKEDASNQSDLLLRVQELNTASASFIRSKKNTEESLEELNVLEKEPVVYSGDLRELFQLKETMLLSRLLHEAIFYYISMNGKSRGSYLVLEGKDGGILSKELETDPDYRDMVLTTSMQGGRVINKLRPVRPIPESDTWFEEVWRKYREGEIFTLK
ncbi:MAG: FAD-binding protein [Treponema sp.]|jgi:succinate dehydrogenase/fumarate reductase flavoprotein subunit|nr:FAD-binding protein [Treponema sp.]